MATDKCFNSAQKMFFRKSKVKQDDDTSFQESGEFTYLYVPNIVRYYLNLLSYEIAVDYFR